MRALLLGLLVTLFSTAVGWSQSGARAADAGSAVFEFNGLIRTGDQILVCVTSLPERHSRWIAVGSQSDGIKVARYDASSQQIVVEAAGRSHTVALRQSTPVIGNRAGGAVAASDMAPLPVAPTVARAPVTNEEKEREARFLVSDLLEIGMIQRKAYEEAQKKKAAAPPPPPKTNR